MEIRLTPKESEDLFYNSICNLCGYLSGYGLELSYNEEDYKAAKDTIFSESKTFSANELKNSPCYEDVLMKILRMGKSLIMIDHEGEGDMTREISLKDVHERVQKTPLNHLQDAINETDDVVTADVIIQTVFFEDIIFG